MALDQAIVLGNAGILEAGREKGIFAFEGEAQNKAANIFSNLVAGLQLARVINLDCKNFYQNILEDLKP